MDQPFSEREKLALTDRRRMDPCACCFLCGLSNLELLRKREGECTTFVVVSLGKNREGECLPGFPLCWDCKKTVPSEAASESALQGYLKFLSEAMELSPVT